MFGLRCVRQHKAMSRDHSRRASRDFLAHGWTQIIPRLYTSRSDGYSDCVLCCWKRRRAAHALLHAEANTSHGSDNSKRAVGTSEDWAAFVARTCGDSICIDRMGSLLAYFLSENARNSGRV